MRLFKVIKSDLLDARVNWILSNFAVDGEERCLKVDQIANTRRVVDVIKMSVGQRDALINETLFLR